MEVEEPDFLIRLRVAIDAGQALPKEVGQRVLSAFDKYEKKKTIRLCQAFELGKPGQSPKHQKRLAKRNYYLRVAFDSVCLEPLRDWVRARRLADAINRFESATWPKVMNLDFPPNKFNEVQKALFYAKKIGKTLPTSQQSLFNITKKK